jgi:hypothetical protein
MLRPDENQRVEQIHRDGATYSVVLTVSRGFTIHPQRTLYLLNCRHELIHSDSLAITPSTLDIDEVVLALVSGGTSFYQWHIDNV